MSLAVNSGYQRTSDGSKNKIVGTLAFDSSYPTGGETLTPDKVGLSRFDSFEIKSRESGYGFEVSLNTDGSIATILVYGGTGAQTSGTGSAHTHTFTGTADASPLVVEEVVSVSSDTGTLANIPAYITSIDVTAGDTTGAFSVIPTGETPLTTQCDVDFTTGVLTFLNTDAVTSVRVTYFPKRTGTMWAQMTVDETATAAAAKVNLAARAAAVQYVYDTTGGTVLTPVPVGEAPGSGEYALDIDDSSNTSIDTNADIDGNTLKVTYLPYSALPSPDMHIGDADITLSSEAWNFTSDGGYGALVVPGHGCHVVGEATTTNQASLWAGPSGTAGAGVARWRPAVNDILTNEGSAMTTMAIPWIIMPVWALPNHTPAGTNANESAHTHSIAADVSDEVSNGTNLTSLSSVEFEAIGV